MGHRKMGQAHSSMLSILYASDTLGRRYHNSAFYNGLCGIFRRRTNLLAIKITNHSSHIEHGDWVHSAERIGMQELVWLRGEMRELGLPIMI